MKSLLIIYGIAFTLAGLLIVAVPADYRGDAEFIFASGGDLKTIDPQRTSMMIDFRVLECLYETLASVDPATMGYEPAAAERWEISEDGKTYTFHIREEARWSNGDPVTSHDYVYGWRRAMLPDSAADYTTMFYPIVGAEDFFNWRAEELEKYAERPAKERTAEAAQALWDESMAKFDELVGLEAPNDRTLIVRLTNPTAYFLELAAFMPFAPIHRESFSQYLDPPNADSGRRSQATTYFRAGRLIGNGPYVLERRRPKRDVLMSKNPHYWDRENVESETVLMRVIDSGQTALLAYRNGEVDWWPDVPAGDPIAAELVASGDEDVHSYGVCGSYYLFFNCTDKLTDGRDNPFKDKRVRWAFSLTIDRKKIVEQVTKLNQPVADALIPRGVFPGYESPETDVRYDPDKARELLAEASFPGGEGLDRLSVMFNANAGHEEIFQQLINNWEKELGVSLELDIRESNVFFDSREKHDFAVARGNWYGDYGDPTTYLDMYRTEDGNNDGGWSNPQFDELLNKAAQEVDRDKRMIMLQDAERILMEEQPIAPIFYYIQIELFNKDHLQNYHLNPLLHREIERMKIVKNSADKGKDSSGEDRD